jgi:hypothetical protein
MTVNRPTIREAGGWVSPRLNPFYALSGHAAEVTEQAGHIDRARGQKGGHQHLVHRGLRGRPGRIAREAWTRLGARVLKFVFAKIHIAFTESGAILGHAERALSPGGVRIYGCLRSNLPRQMWGALARDTTCDPGLAWHSWGGHAKFVSLESAQLLALRLSSLFSAAVIE